MLGYIAGAAIWGLAKSWSNDLERSPHALSGLGAAELLEEVQFRMGLEHGLGRNVLKLSPTAARIGASALFGLVHPGHALDAAIGGLVYSKAYEDHGLLGSTLAHCAHNIGVHLGGK